MAIKKKLGESPQKMSPITHCHISVGCQKTKEKFWGKKRKKKVQKEDEIMVWQNKLVLFSLLLCDAACVHNKAPLGEA